AHAADRARALGEARGSAAEAAALAASGRGRHRGRRPMVAPASRAADRRDGGARRRRDAGRSGGRATARALRRRLPLPDGSREILWALRRFEARGTARGGRFVSGFVGEQYALPEAVDLLRQTRRRERSGEIVRVAAVDPLNLVGILTPGPRVPAQRGNLVVYC